MRQYPGAMPGAPSGRQLAATSMAPSVGQTSLRYQWMGAYDNPQAQTEFPLVATTKDPYDDVAAQKSAVAMSPNGHWNVPYTQADAEYETRKRIVSEQAAFDSWVNDKYNLTDPSQNFLLQSIAPDLYQRREEVIDNLQGLVTRYAKLRLRGAKNEEDLRFQWLIDTGRLQLPTGPIWQPKRWREEEAKRFGISPEQFDSDRFYYGLFSPAYWITAGNRGQAADKTNLFDIAGSNKPYRNASVPVREDNAGYFYNYPDPMLPPGTATPSHSTSFTPKVTAFNYSFPHSGGKPTGPTVSASSIPTEET